MSLRLYPFPAAPVTCSSGMEPLVHTGWSCGPSTFAKRLRFRTQPINLLRIMHGRR